ncbi:hypothetical protein [Frankia sp. AvcI1]|nr:hypothetical protein [Frankia sp. AvcI1]
MYATKRAGPGRRLAYDTLMRTPIAGATSATTPLDRRTTVRALGPTASLR